MFDCTQIEPKLIRILRRLDHPAGYERRHEPVRPDAATFLIAKIFDPHPGYPTIMEQTFHG